jgi:hypothetical protein
MISAPADVFWIDAQASFAAIVLNEESAMSILELSEGTAPVAVWRDLKLDHLGTQIGHQATRSRAGHHLCEIEYLEAIHHMTKSIHNRTPDAPMGAPLAFARDLPGSLAGGKRLEKAVTKMSVRIGTLAHLRSRADESPRRREDRDLPRPT